MSQPPGWVATKTSWAKVPPPSRERSNQMPAGPDHATYTWPSGPTAGMAPSTVLSPSCALPPASLTRSGADQLSPWSVEREKRMRVLSAGLLLP